MKILFFGSKECENCDALLRAFSLQPFPSNAEDGSEINLIYIDAFADSQQNFCDQHNVDELPRLKVFDETNRIVLDKEGYFNPSLLWKVFFKSDIMIKEAKKNRSNKIKISTRGDEKPFNLSKRK